MDPGSNSKLLVFLGALEICAMTFILITQLECIVSQSPGIVVGTIMLLLIAILQGCWFLNMGLESI